MPAEVNGPVDARQLVRWLGAEGALAGLLQSKTMTVDSLRKLAQSLGIHPPEKMARATIVAEIVREANRKLDKPIDELLTMEFKQLVKYFEDVDVEPPELLDVLKQLNLSPRRESRRGLIELVAKEISETGRFQRIAGKGSQARSHEAGLESQVNR